MGHLHDGDRDSDEADDERSNERRESGLAVNIVMPFRGNRALHRIELDRRECCPCPEKPSNSATLMGGALGLAGIRRCV